MGNDFDSYRSYTTDHDTVRRDGLSIHAARRTVEHICRPIGRMGSAGAWRLESLCAWEPERFAEVMRTLVEVHGFAAELRTATDPGHVILRVDYRACPEDASQAEREWLAEAEATASGAGSQQYAWCMGQTCVFLRHRADNSARAASDVQPPSGWEDRAVERARRDGAIP